MSWYDTWWWWCDDACYDDALYDVHTLLHCMMMIRWVDDYQTLMMICSDLHVWWLDSNQQCWWAAWPAVLMFNMTVMTWAERWCGSDIYRDDLTVTRAQRLLSSSEQMNKMTDEQCYSRVDMMSRDDEQRWWCDRDCLCMMTWVW